MSGTKRSAGPAHAPPLRMHAHGPLGVIAVACKKTHKRASAQQRTQQNQTDGHIRDHESEQNLTCSALYTLYGMVRFLQNVGVMLSVAPFVHVSAIRSAMARRISKYGPPNRK